MRSFPETDPGASDLHARWYEANRVADALTAQRCVCGRWRAPARYRCAGCGGDEWTFEPVTQRGTIHSWTITRRPLHFAFAEAVPYAIVVVETPEGVRVLLQHRDDPDGVAIGVDVAIAVDRFGVPYASGIDD